MLKSRKILSISSHKGIRSFTSAFLSFSVGFLILFFLQIIPKDNSAISTMLYAWFYYSLALGGFYFTYSLFWRKWKGKNLEVIIHLFAVLVALLDTFVFTGWFSSMFVSLIILSLIACISSYHHYKCDEKKVHSFKQMHLIAVILMFLGFSINYLATFFEVFMIYAQSITLCIFIIFTFGVMKKRTCSCKKKDFRKKSKQSGEK